MHCGWFGEQAQQRKVLGRGSLERSLGMGNGIIGIYTSLYILPTSARIYITYIPHRYQPLYLLPKPPKNDLKIREFAHSLYSHIFLGSFHVTHVHNDSESLEHQKEMAVRYPSHYGLPV